jgi:hypothetical protein
MYSGIGILGETLYVKFVDDRIPFRAWWNISCPIELTLMSSQYSQRRLSCIGAWLGSQFAVKLRGEKDTFRIGIEEHLIGVEGVEPRKALS